MSALMETFTIPQTNFPRMVSEATFMPWIRPFLANQLPDAESDVIDTALNDARRDIEHFLSHPQVICSIEVNIRQMIEDIIISCSERFLTESSSHKGRPPRRIREARRVQKRKHLHTLLKQISAKEMQRHENVVTIFKQILGDAFSDYNALCEKMIQSCEDFVHSRAQKFPPSIHSGEDLISEGLRVLKNAVYAYNPPSHTVRFKTYLKREMDHWAERVSLRIRDEKK